MEVDIRVSCVPPAVLGELGGLLARCDPGAGSADAGGPRVVSSDVAGEQLTVVLTADVIAESIGGALTVSSLDRRARTGWQRVGVADLTVVAGSAGRPPSISFRVPKPSPDVLTRVVLSGTGATPMLGLVGGTLVPLAGRVGGPPGSVENGHDVVVVVGAD